MSEARSARSNFFGAIIAGLTVVAFSLLLLWHDPLVFWNDDYQISILPVFADVARSWHEGHWPLLSPYSWVCGNLAGEFQYGTFSVFVNTVVILIWKFSLTFPQQAAALSITHLFVLGAGAFVLARERLRRHEAPSPLAPASSSVGEQSSPPGRGGRRSRLVMEITSRSFSLSVFVSLVASLNGWMICWGATDWFGALGAFAWLPWAWWGLERAAGVASADVASASSRCSDGHGQDARATNRWRCLWPAPFVYLVVTGGFPYTVVTLVILIAWLSFKTFVERKSLLAVLPMWCGVALGFGLSAPAYLAILDYVHGSAREAQPAAAHWQWIVPWRALPALILPAWTANWTDFSSRYLPHAGTELACGLVAPVALVAGLITRTRVLVRQIKWELCLLLLVLVLSMVPTVGLFRWSFRWLPMFHLVLALCAAEALHQNGFEDRRARALMLLLLLGLTSVAMPVFGTGGLFEFPLTWIFLILAATYAVAELFVPWDCFRRWLPPSLTFAALLATYFCIPSNCGVPKYNFSQELTKPEPLDQKRLYLAVYSPAEFVYRREYRAGPVGQVARPGSTPMWAALRFVNGYSPILAAGVARELKFFIHGEIDGDFGKYLVENQSGPGGILEELGVDGIVIAREISAQPAPSSWQLEFSNDEGAVFHRRGNPLGLARSVTWIDSRPNDEFSNATISDVRDHRNSIELDVRVPAGERPALITFARPYFRGYDARLGNKKLPVESYRGLFPMVEIPAGSSGQLVLSYRPWWLVVGSTITSLSFLIGVGAALAAARRGSTSRSNGVME